MFSITGADGDILYILYSEMNDKTLGRLSVKQAAVTSLILEEVMQCFGR